MLNIFRQCYWFFFFLLLPTQYFIVISNDFTHSPHDKIVIKKTLQRFNIFIIDRPSCYFSPVKSKKRCVNRKSQCHIKETRSTLTYEYSTPVEFNKFTLLIQLVENKI